jgi:hypothetical protein
MTCSTQADSLRRRRFRGPTRRRSIQERFAILFPLAQVVPDAAAFPICEPSGFAAKSKPSLTLRSFGDRFFRGQKQLAVFGQDGKIRATDANATARKGKPRFFID